jgi:hypothetical protein
MIYLLLGVLLLGGIMLARDAFLKADPKVLAKNMKRIAGNAALIVAFGLLVTGRFFAAIPFAVIGYLLIGRLPFLWIDLGGGGARSGGQSTVRTEMLEMVLDHDTGTTEGFVRTGTFAGRRLSELSRTELGSLLDEARQRDRQAAQLLEAYISRLDGDAGGDRASSGSMSKEEALEVLGLKLGATHDDILAAHRALMKKMHPDLGGSNYLAKKINEAKDVLLH